MKYMASTNETAGNLHTEVNYLSENLIKLLAIHQISGADLAKALNIPYNTVHRIITGTTSDPRLSTLQQFSEYFGVSLDFFLSDNNNKNTQQKNSINIPFLNWEKINTTNFMEDLKKENNIKWVNVADLDVNNGIEHFFALASTKSMQPRFPFGTIFIIKINEKPIDGDLILIRFRENNNITLRELIIDSPHWQLNPIIPGSPAIVFKHEDHMIVGVIVLTLMHTRSY